MYFQLLRGWCARTRLTPLRRVAARKALTYRTPVLKWDLCAQTCNLEGYEERVTDASFCGGKRFEIFGTRPVIRGGALPTDLRVLLSVRVQNRLAKPPPLVFQKWLRT